MFLASRGYSEDLSVHLSRVEGLFGRTLLYGFKLSSSFSSQTLIIFPMTLVEKNISAAWHLLRFLANAALNSIKKLGKKIKIKCCGFLMPAANKWLCAAVLCGPQQLSSYMLRFFVGPQQLSSHKLKTRLLTFHFHNPYSTVA